MTKSKFYQESKKLIKYFNDNNINIRTGGQLAQGQVNAVKKKFVSKGSTIKFWKRHTEKLEKIKNRSSNRTNIKREIANRKMTGIYYYTLTFSISRDYNQTRTSKINITTPSTQEEILNVAFEHAQRRYFDVFETNTFNTSLSISRGVPIVGQSIMSMKINDVKFFKLKGVCSANEHKIREHCVNFALSKFYGKLPYFTKKARKALKEIDNWTVESFIKYLDEFKLDYQIYYKGGELLEADDTHGRKMLYCYVANEHLYLMNNKDFSFLYENEDNLITDVQYCPQMANFIYKNIVKQAPTNFSIKYNVELQVNQFTSCVFNGIKYTSNQMLDDAYVMYKKIFSKMHNYIDFMFDKNFKVYTPLMEIAKQNKLGSTFVDFMNSPKPLHYNTGGEGDFCIDKNKAYSWSLKDLKNVPVINSSTPIEPFNGEINQEYFYFIENVKYDDHGRNVLGWCSGFRIKNIKNVVITKQIKPKLIKNPFTDLINQMADEDQDITKTACNLFYGMCQTKPSNNIIATEILKTSHGYDSSEVEACEGLFVKVKEITDNTKFISNMVPVSHFIVDNMINEMFKIIEQIKPEKIIKLKTDSITYIGSPVNFNLCEYDFNGWKEEEVKIEDWKNTDTPIEYKTIEDVGKHMDLNKNILFDCIAGAGKTYACINDLLPALKGKTVVISATCKALEDYHNIDEMENVHIKTIQHFVNLDSIPITKEFQSYDNIVIDEVGLFDVYMFEYLYKKMVDKQHIYAFGDKEQLEPVMGESVPMENENIINTFFDEYHELNENWRNNFLVSEYQEMKDLKYTVPQKIKECFGRVSLTNICYTNDTKERVNSEIVKDWVDTFGERVKLTSRDVKSVDVMKVKIGGRIISVNNKLKMLEIFNSQVFKILKYTKKDITIKNISTKKEYCLTQLQFNKNFDYGYALTLYKIQGESIKINKLGIFDWHLIKNNGKRMYTCLSRIKEKLTTNPKPYNLTFKYEEEEQEENVTEKKIIKNKVQEHTKHYYSNKVMFQLLNPNKIIKQNIKKETKKNNNKINIKGIFARWF